MLAQDLDATATRGSCRFQNPQVLGRCLLTLLLEQPQIVGQDPSLGHDIVLIAELANLRRNIPEHQVFSTELPCASEVITMLIHVIIPQRFWLERGTPQHIPARAVCLREAVPAERVYYAVIGVHTLSDFELHLELVLLHLEDVITINRLGIFVDSRGILEEDSWRPAYERALAEIDWHLLRVRIGLIIRFNLVVSLGHLALKRSDRVFLQYGPRLSILSLLQLVLASS